MTPKLDLRTLATWNAANVAARIDYRLAPIRSCHAWGCFTLTIESRNCRWHSGYAQRRRIDEGHR